MRPAGRYKVHERQQRHVRQRDAGEAPLGVSAGVPQEVDDSGEAPADRCERGAAGVDCGAEHEQQHDGREVLQRVLVGALDAVEGSGVARGVECRVFHVLKRGFWLEEEEEEEERMSEETKSVKKKN